MFLSSALLLAGDPSWSQQTTGRLRSQEEIDALLAPTREKQRLTQESLSSSRKLLAKAFGQLEDIDAQLQYVRGGIEHLDCLGSASGFPNDVTSIDAKIVTLLKENEKAGQVDCGASAEARKACELRERNLAEARALAKKLSDQIDICAARHRNPQTTGKDYEK